MEAAVGMVAVGAGAAAGTVVVVVGMEAAVGTGVVAGMDVAAGDVAAGTVDIGAEAVGMAGGPDTVGVVIPTTLTIPIILGVINPVRGGSNRRSRRSQRKGEKWLSSNAVTTKHPRTAFL
jgi:hypothetical protein